MKRISGKINRTMAVILSLLMIVSMFGGGGMQKVEAAEGRIVYRTHVQDYGWLGWTDGISGTEGEGRRIEAVEIMLEGVSGNIAYKTHVQDYGWLGDVRNGQTSGTTGESRRVESIQIWLEGDAANAYSIQYRVHQQNVGWEDWVSDGMSAGYEGQSLQLEAIEIRLVSKNGNTSDSGQDETLNYFQSNVGNRIAYLEGYNTNLDGFNGIPGQCVWYVRNRGNERLGSQGLTGISGNAKTWFTAAQNKGLGTGDTPRANAIACWSGGSYGHVAYLEYYDQNTCMVYFTEANFGGNGTEDGVLKAMNFDDFKNRKSGWQGFIYLQ